MEFQSVREYNPIDNIPVANMFLDILPGGLGTSDKIVKPKARCGCKETFATINNSTNINSTTLVANEVNGYDVLNISPNEHKFAFDEFGEEEEEEDDVEITNQEDDVEFESENSQNKGFDFVTNIYVGSLSIIGLFTLYRLIHKTR